MAYVYILRNGNENLFKIGKSGDVEDRLRDLTTGNIRLAVFDMIETEDENEWEQYLHKRLRSKRFRGTSAQEIFEITPEALRIVLREAREFLPSFLQTRQAAEALADERSTDQMVPPSRDDVAIYEELLGIREQEDRCNYQRLHLENKLKLAIGTAAGLDGLASWKTLTKQRFDQAAFKEEQSELYQKYSATVFERRFVPRVSSSQCHRQEAEAGE